MAFLLCLFWCSLIISSDACIDPIHMEQDMEITLEATLGCEINVNLSPDLLAQVTCTSVSGDLSDGLCSDKALTITADNGDEANFCIIENGSKSGLVSSIDRLYDGAHNLRFKVDFMKRDMSPSMTSCSISTKKRRMVSNQRSLLSVFQGMLDLPSGLDFLNDCGKVKVIPEERRIFGGQETFEHNYNFMVVIIKEDLDGNPRIMR